ncbi:hypothetical protein [Phytomonospora endophytica]|uniref:Uncharacterized protein n=1 Tax=Phytomonospora endophytica TaxID=714109 RepID=A0A841G0Y1_9ACTN|nr:hypothetical protein [Phytomonospora endophytica]MBB6038339.1 hypothetical protein [Phytomonospora endophytica]GIG64269.1 hypothetical protein Pen01_05640 [Phytomonospora endophytica]
MSAVDLAEAWAVWDAHDQVITPYRVCREGCREEWPCTRRRRADLELREAGVDPFAIRRKEATLPGT